MKLFPGQCRYCYHNGQLATVRMRSAIGNNKWAEITAICGDCRKYLRGFFKYVRKAKR